MILFRKRSAQIKQEKKVEKELDSSYTNGITAYSGFCKNNDELKNSASGGAAYALYKSVLQSNGIVYGVGYTDDYRNAKYYEVINDEELHILQSSKYIQSKKTLSVDGKEVKMEVSVGDKVILNKYAGTEVKLGQDKYTIVRQSDILAVVE